MSSPDAPRPAKLYRYAPRAHLERALSHGEFRLRPAGEDLRVAATAPQILPFGTKPRSAAAASYLILSLSTTWDPRLYADFPGADSCLIIHDPESFGERIHRAAQRALPNWAGIDAAVAYGVPSPLGAAFSKEKQLARQKEWLFAWRPIQAMMSVNPVTIEIGNLESIAELRQSTD
jgi:hypothetical protein